VASAAKAGLAITFYSSEPPDPRLPADFPYRVCPPRRLGAAGGAYWMSGLTRMVQGADIIIAPQEMRCLSVLWLWLQRRRACQYWIWFGHGYNAKLAPRRARRSIVERLREFVTPRSQGIITYTQGGAELWRRRGMASGRARWFNNTIDVGGFRRFYRPAKRRARLLKRELGIDDNHHILLFCGRMYGGKRLDVLIDAFAILKRRTPNITLLIVGDGPERRPVEARARASAAAGVFFFGEIVDPVKLSAYFAAADALVIPGLVGLAIVQGFAFGLPLVATNCKGHGPEFEYLTPNNGIVTALEPEAYAAGIEGLVASTDRLRCLKKSAWATGTALSLPFSVERFVDAILGIADGETGEDPPLQ
jgi:glycosyltransferase involved in cell wall biosynthesis